MILGRHHSCSHGFRPNTQFRDGDQYCTFTHLARRWAKAYVNNKKALAIARVGRGTRKLLGTPYLDEKSERRHRA
jgi:hypothetical protein